MELNYLRYFYEVAHTGSVTRAARNLRIAQPSVSKIIRLLEDREGVRLFERDRRGMKLTREGELFFTHSQRIFAEVERLQQAVRTEKEGVSGALSFGASDNLCLHVLPAILKKYARRYPGVTVSMYAGTSQGILEELRERRCEFGLFYTATTDERFSTQALAMVPFRLVLRPELAKQAKLPVTNFERARGVLRGMDFIGSRGVDYQRAYPVMGMLRSLGLEPTVRVEVNQHEVQKRLVLDGLGYSLLPSPMVEADILAGRLVSVRLPRPVESPLLWVERRGWARSAAAEHFHQAFCAGLARAAPRTGLRILKSGEA